MFRSAVDIELMQTTNDFCWYENWIHTNRNTRRVQDIKDMILLICLIFNFVTLLTLTGWP